MFTPPPSPAKLTAHGSLELSPTLEKDAFVYLDEPPPLSPSEAKKGIGRRMRLSVVAVPLVLIFIGMSTRWITHPFLLDLLTTHPPPEDRSNQTDKPTTIWQFHKRHPSPASQVTSAVVSSPALSQSGTGFPSTVIPPTVSNSPSESPSPTKLAPTIPASPPVLPTPFPQPFDSSLQANFTNAGCYNFFLNMTSTQPFRSCRPFSLLLQSSSQFINTQSNPNTANAVQWGTCNTSIDQDQCLKNTDWFTTNLETACSVDLSQRNTLAVNALQGLQAYGLMRKAGCLPDPSTNTYCFIEAISEPNPSDLYYYLLPLGITAPNTSTPTCSACSKSLLALYGTVLSNSSQAILVGDGLRKTFASTAASANAHCGSGFAPSVKTSAGRRGHSLGARRLLGAIVAIAVSLAFVS